MSKDHTVCSQCKAGDLRDATEVVVRELDTISFEAVVPSWRCERCNHVELDPLSLRQFEKQIASELIKIGAQSGTAFKYMRKIAGLRASDLAELLNVDSATISRWENGKGSVDRAALATVGAIIRDGINRQQATVEHLRSLGKPDLGNHRRSLSINSPA